MANPIRFDTSGRPEEPTFVLATKGGAKLGNLIAIEGQHYHSQFMNADEICFDVNQYIDGVLNPLWDSIVDFKLAWYQEIDRWFEITVELDESDKRVKHVEGTALCESELSQTNIYDVEINTETDIANDDYEITVFYDPTDVSKSLLNRVLYKNPNYTIGHVDSSLRNIQRSFSWSSSTTYDALQDIASEVGCVFLFGNGSDSNGLPSRTVNAYDLMYTCLDCGHRFEGNRATCPKCGSALISEPFGDETGIIVSRDNLTDDIQYSSDTSSVKNCFRLVAGDDAMTAAVRQVMADGSGYLWHFSNSMKTDMSDDLQTALADFDDMRDEYNTTHQFSVNSDSYNYIVDKYVNGTPTLISATAKLSTTDGIAIDKTPSDVVGIVGEDATFSVSASGSGLIYQWQSSRDSGANWVNLTSAVTGYNTDTITLEITEENIGYIYRCLITDSNSNSVCSSSAALTTATAVDYGTCGDNLNWYLDTDGTLHILGTGAMANYALGEAPWYSHRTDILKIMINSGVTTVGSYAFISCTSLTRVHIPTSVTVIGDSAFRNCDDLETIYIPSGVTTISQYAFNNCNALGNLYISGSVASIGTNAFLNCYSLWQVNYGSTETAWENISIDSTGNSSLTDTTINYNFTILSGPDDNLVAVGETASFQVITETGADCGTITYQWQYSTNNGETWTNNSGTGYNTDTFEFSMAARFDGRLYRCVITQTVGENTITYYSEPGTLALLSTVILTQPETQTRAIGQTAIFQVVASGSSLTYQWQYSNNGGSSWKNLNYEVHPSSLTSTLTFPVYAKYNEFLYRCKITDSNSKVVYSDTAIIHVASSFSIVEQPESVIVAKDTTATFTVVASGSNLNYQWQYSMDNGVTWHNIGSSNASASTATLSIAASSTINGRQYRCVVTGTGGTSTGKDFVKIYSGDSSVTSTGTIRLIGYPTLVEGYYSSSDLYYYLHDSMMPDYTVEERSIDDQLDDLVDGLSAGITVASVSKSTSTATIETFIKSLSKLYMEYSKYSVLVNTSTWTPSSGSGVWQGTVTLMNREDSTDDATSSQFTVNVTTDADDLYAQSIAYKLEEYSSTAYDISSLFAMEMDDFVEALGSYSLTCLQEFLQCAEGCRSVLIDGGLGAQGTINIGGSEWDGYEEMYVPFTTKILAIQSEIDARATELAIVEQMTNDLLALMQECHETLNFEDYLIDASLWNEFLAYRREDEYKNDNYISDGLTDAEIIDNARQFLLAASEAIYKASELQHTIKSSLHNLLAIPAFSALTDHFAVGAWIWIIVDDKPYRLRLLEFEIDWDNLDKINVEFSDVETTSSGVSDLASLFKSASSMASSYGGTVRKAKEGDNAKSTLDAWYQDGIRATATKISNADSQTMVMDETGMILRRMDDLTETYDSEQAKWINTTLAFTDDGWQTVRVAIGKIVVDGVEHYGILADCVYGQFGKFVTLDADQLTVGTIQDATGTNYWNLETGELHLAAVDGEMSALNDSIMNAYAAINMTNQSIQTTVASSYSNMKDYVDGQIGGVSTTITQTANEIRYDFGQTTGDLSKTIADNQSEFQKYIRFENGTIQLGQKDNPMSAELSSTELAFKQNSQTVAYISNNSLMITNAEVENKLSIGVNTRGWFDYIPRENGNLSLVWRPPTAPDAIRFISNPADVVCVVGNTISVSVNAVGPTVLSYQWQYSTNSGTSWANCSGTGYNTDTFSWTATASHNGRQYRCKVTDTNSNTAFSKAATIIVNAS